MADLPDSSDSPKAKPPALSGWAKRSTGLEGDVTPPSKPDADGGEDSVALWKLAGLGFQIGASLAVFIGIGYWIDLKAGWPYAGVITGALIAIVGSIYLLIKEAKQLLK